MAVPPDLVGFVESAGLAAVGYGPDSQEQVNAVADFVHHAFRLQNPISLVRAGRELFVEGWAQMSRTLTSLADGADLLVTGQTYHGVVANVAEYYDIPLAGLHHIPICVNGRLALPSIPSPAPAGPLLIEGGLVAVLAHQPRTSTTRNAVNWAYREQRPLRRNGWRNVDRSKSRPTTRLAFRASRRNGTAGDPSSAR